MPVSIFIPHDLSAVPLILKDSNGRLFVQKLGQTYRPEASHSDTLSAERGWGHGIVTAFEAGESVTVKLVPNSPLLLVSREDKAAEMWAAHSTYLNEQPELAWRPAEPPAESARQEPESLTELFSREPKPLVQVTRLVCRRSA